MKNIALEISNSKDEVLVMSVLEAFQKKKMIRFQVVSNGQAEKKFPEEMYRKMEKMMREMDLEIANEREEDDLTREGPPVSKERLSQAIDKAENSGILTYEEGEVFFELLKKEIMEDKL